MQFSIMTSDGSASVPREEMAATILGFSTAYRFGQNYESSVHNIKGIIKTSKDPHNLSVVHKIHVTVKSNIKIAYKILKKQYLDNKSPHTIRNKHLS